MRAFDTDDARAQGFATEMSSTLDLDVSVVEHPREAVSGCDLVVTSGPILKTPHATIQAGWLEEGAFASLVDFDSYWHPDALREVTKICTDDKIQFLYYQSEGYFQDTPDIHAELGELVTGQKTGRESAQERTMAVNLGLAMDDMAVAPLIYQRALDQEIGTWLPR